MRFLRGVGGHECIPWWASPRHAQPCCVPKALLTAMCLHHCHWVYMCAVVSVCACVCAHVCPAAEQDPIWFAPLACEAWLWGSTSLYSPNGFPSPLLLTLPQTPVMCTLVNIHIKDSKRGGRGGRKKTKTVMHGSEDGIRRGRKRVKGSGIKVRQRVQSSRRGGHSLKTLTLGLGSL